MAYDKDINGPSVTLLFVWISGALATTSLIALNFTDKTLSAAMVSITFWSLAVVFYRLRKLDKFKLDLDDRSIEIEAQDEKID